MFRPHAPTLHRIAHIAGSGARSLCRRLRSEAGMSLVLSLGMTTMFGITGTTAMVYTTQNEVSTARSKADRSALSLAEAGLNNAYSTLYNASDPTMPGAVPERVVQMEGGTVTYSATLSQDGKTWTLTGVGQVANAGHAADVSRTVRARVSLGSSTHGSANNAVWNYVYSDDLTTCMTLSNSVVVNVPLYVRGNLCMQNSAQFTGYSLQVGDTLTLNNSSQVGGSSPPVNEAHVGGGCRLDSSGPFSSPCGPAQRVYSTVAPDANTTGLVKPPVDLAGWYQNSKPGPMQNCTSGSFPGGFDNDTTMNRSRGPVTLLTASAYDCQVIDAQGNLLGRLAWNPSTKLLTIAGTIFFDGDIEFSNSAQATYDGRATIYSSGTITFRNSSKICGSPGCNEEWNATEDLLAFVAGSSTDAIGIELENSSVFQGASYAVSDYRQGNSVVAWGPVIADQVHLMNSTSNHYVPLGTLLPGMPATYDEAVTLQNEGGSWGS